MEDDRMDNKNDQKRSRNGRCAVIITRSVGSGRTGSCYRTANKGREWPLCSYYYMVSSLGYYSVGNLNGKPSESSLERRGRKGKKVKTVLVFRARFSSGLSIASVCILCEIFV